MDRYYKIAGLHVKMDTFGRTADLAFPYLTDAHAAEDITVAADHAKVKADYPHAGEESLEYIGSGRDFYTKLIDFDGMMLHASAISMDGKAYLFSADSGIGKSTHTGLWRQVFGDERVRIINDDKPALRLEDGIWYVYGTPWSGKYGLNHNLRCPLAGICFLDRGQTNKIEPYLQNDLVFQFMKQTYRGDGPRRKMKVLSNIDRLIKGIPVWHLECNMEREAALLSYAVMSGKEK